MAWIQRFGTIMILLYWASTSALVFSDLDDFFECETTVSNWAKSSTDNGIKEDTLKLKDLLFFLHVPRTGGRTYYHCFLRKLYTGTQECPRSYDKLRFDPSKTNCRLMATHDDYSFMSKLPKERTSVVTVLRNPVDRVFSTYEFSVEVAARSLVHPNLTSATQMSRRIRPKSRTISTLDIWPWKYLVPWMREDLFARRDSRQQQAGRLTREINNPYDMEHMLMPLHVLINQPIAHDIIHNGATFQVAGLTNNSYLSESHKVRHCVRNYPTLGRYVLEVAKNRLDHMLYIGLTEDHKNSVMMFANMVGGQVLSQSAALSSHVDEDASKKTETSFSIPYSEADGSNHSKSSDGDELIGGFPSTDVGTKNRSRTVGKLMEAYEVCISTLRKSQASRRTLSLKRIAPANFSSQARLQVPEVVIQEMESLNSLDMDLYLHAQNIFMQQQRRFDQDDPRHEQLLLSNDDLPIPSNCGVPCHKASIEFMGKNILRGYSIDGWEILMAVMVPLAIIVFYYVVISHRGVKLKV